MTQFIMYNPKELLKMIEYNMYNGNKRPLCMNYHHEAKTPVFFDTKEEVNMVMKSLKAYRKDGTIVCNKKHLYTKMLKKKPVYCITVQQTPLEQNPIDPIGLALGIQIAGITYWFSNEKNRDAMFEWINR